MLYGFLLILCKINSFNKEMVTLSGIILLVKLRIGSNCGRYLANRQIYFINVYVFMYFKCMLLTYGVWRFEN